MPALLFHLVIVKKDWRISEESPLSDGRADGRWAPLQLNSDLGDLCTPHSPPGWRNRLLAECVASDSLLQWEVEQLHVSKAVWENNPPKSRHIAKELPNICSLLCMLHHTLAAPVPVYSAGLTSKHEGRDPSQAQDLQQALKAITMSCSHLGPLQSPAEWNLSEGSDQHPWSEET